MRFKPTATVLLNIKYIELAKFTDELRKGKSKVDTLSRKTESMKKMSIAAVVVSPPQNINI